MFIKTYTNILLPQKIKNDLYIFTKYEQVGKKYNVCHYNTWKWKIIMYDITRLYPQYQRTQDRRKQNIPVAVDRRSGVDRRSSDRVALDSKLTRDIFEVKSKVAQLESLSPKLFENNVVKQAPSFSSMNQTTQDILVKETKPDPTEIARQEAKLMNRQATAFQLGVIAASLAAAIGLASLSSAGAVIAVGTGLYIGARILKSLIVRELKDDNEKISDK